LSPITVIGLRRPTDNGARTWVAA